jgi:hypothetical protein
MQNCSFPFSSPPLPTIQAEYFAARQELGEYKFFLLQAVAITIEDRVIWL